jgi:hypothetical protein
MVKAATKPRRRLSTWRVACVDRAATVEAHVELFSKYTDADIHNLMAYLQTLH